MAVKKISYSQRMRAMKEMRTTTSRNISISDAQKTIFKKFVC
jgi:hypothetical protein